MNAHSTAPTLLLAGLALLASACQPTAEAARPEATPAQTPLEVVTAAVEELPMPRVLAVTGSLVANQQSAVAADVAGKVLQLAVERGSFVAKGAPLAKLDAQNAALSASAAKAELEVARAQSDLAAAECQRSEKLFAEHAIAQAAFDRTQAECSARRWAVEAASTKLAMTEKLVADSTIRAPFSGMVSERYVSAGEYVRPDSRVVTLLDIDPIRLELTVPEDSVAFVKEGTPVTFEVASYPAEKFQGTIRFIGPAVRPQSRDVVIEAVIENRARRLRPGMFARAELALGERPALVIPASAVRKDTNGGRVFVVVDGHLEERPVKLGRELGERVAIDRGVSSGERVVSRLGPSVVDGARVR